MITVATAMISVAAIIRASTENNGAIVLITDSLNVL
jgi:hypothetical protein